MRIDPALRALRQDAAPQHAAQARIAAALAEWFAEHRGLFGELEAYGTGAELEDCTGLAGLLGEIRPAQAFTASLAERFAPLLAAEPFARMPLRQSSNTAGATLVLGKTGRAVLALTVRDPGGQIPETVAFADGERIDLVLAGAGEGIVVRRQEVGAFAREPVELGPGTRLSLDLACEALLFGEVRQGLVTLRLSRLAVAPRPSREYRLAGGALLGQAAGDPRSSRHEMMLAVLGRMERADAAPVMADIARDGCEHLRWQALRECLALDAAEGFAALLEVARNPVDPLAAPAGALRAQLLERHPLLAKLEDKPCPV